MPGRLVEFRIYLYAFVARLFFYVPILLHYVEGRLSSTGVEQPRTLSLSLIAVVSLGSILAEYPSGLLADWMGRTRTLILSGVFHALGVLLLWSADAAAWLFAAQLLVGVATAFRSGADTALLHAHLERIGQPDRYGSALARLRFFNVLAIAIASASGGILYEVEPASVFVTSAALSVLASLSLLGLDEGPTSGRRRGYGDVVRESLSELRNNAPARALMVLGGVGNTYFVFAFWATQGQLIDTGVSLRQMGLTVSAMAFLQALTMPLSAWISQHRARQSRALLLFVLLPPASFALVAVGWALQLGSLGTVALVGTGACHVLYRNVVNVRLQSMVPNAVRASIVSLEAWIGSLWYLLFFPLAGWLLSSLGMGPGFGVLCAIVALTTWPLLWFAHRRGVMTRS